MTTNRTSTACRRTFLVVALALCLSLGSTAVAIAKDYSMGPVDISATVSTDGSMSVVEKRTFEFVEDYSFVYWEFDTSKMDALSVSGVSELVGETRVAYALSNDPLATENRTPGTYLVENTGSTTKVSVFFRKQDESATFELSYLVVGGVKRHEDVGEVYWQAIGSGWGATTRDITVSIVTPVPEGTPVVAGENLRAWAHGPLNGVVTVGDDGVVTATVLRVDPGTFVEPRVTMPSDWLSAAPVLPGAKLDEILAEEGRLADEANAERARAKALVTAANVGVPLVSLVAVAFAVFAFMKWGREYKPTFDQPYLREVPDDLHPAAAGSLWRWGAATEADFTATLMHLSIDRVVKLERTTVERPSIFGAKREEDYLLTLDRAKAAELTDPIDRNMVKFLFDRIAQGGDSLPFSRIKQYGKDRPQEFVNNMNDWKAEVKAVGTARGFFEMSGNLGMAGLLVLGFAVAGLGVLSVAALGTWVPMLVGIVSGGVIVALATQMRRRSREANELAARYKALHDYLRDFSKLDEAPPMHVILWERFLVMAVVFGIADQVIKQMKVVVPEVLQDPMFVPAYIWMNPYGSLSAPAEAFRGTVLSAAQVASSQLSSSSGGGGGFSGGGGGGFGGGGGGAG